MNLISAENISRSYGDKELFSESSLGIAEGEKLAIVGINGSGKSSLLKIMAKLDQPDTGRVEWRKGLSVGIMDQETAFLPEHDALEQILAQGYEEIELLRIYEGLLNSADHKSNDQELSKILTRIEVLDAWGFEQRSREMLEKLSVPVDQKLRSFSGGQKRRLSLAMALLGKPDVLILDEPTNHLDLEGIEWLEKELSREKLSFLLITHDRYFLDKVCNRIVEIDEQQLFHYSGSYSHFLEQRTLRKEIQKRTSERARSLLRTELEWLRRMPKARGTKSKKRVESVKKLIEKSKSFREDVHTEIRGVQRRLGGKILEFRKVDFSHGQTKILNGFNYTFRKGERLGITGRNGTGKSSFIKLITGEFSPDMGRIQKGETLRLGYFGQDGLNFKAGQRVIELVREFSETARSVEGSQIRIEDLLNHFLFDYAKQREFIEKLSGGEKRRLYLVTVLLSEPNLLLLDEPTNDLDIYTMNALEEYLQSFGGCVIVVSHDRHFLNKIVDHLFVFQGEGIIKDFPGNYSQYQEWKASQKKDRTPHQKKSAASAEAHAEEKRLRNVGKLSFKERQELNDLEVQISQLEEKKEMLIKAIQKSRDHLQLEKMGLELEELEAGLSEKEMRWVELCEREN